MKITYNFRIPCVINMKLFPNGTIFHWIISKTELPLLQGSVLDQMIQFEIWLDFGGQFGIF